MFKGNGRERWFFLKVRLGEVGQSGWVRKRVGKVIDDVCGDITKGSVFHPVLSNSLNK